MRAFSYLGICKHGKRRFYLRVDDRRASDAQNERAAKDREIVIAKAIEQGLTLVRTKADPKGPLYERCRLCERIEKER